MEESHELYIDKIEYKKEDYKYTHLGKLINQKSWLFEGHRNSYTDHISVYNLVKYINDNNIIINKYVVDIGSNGGSETDILFNYGWLGLKIDGNEINKSDNNPKIINKNITPNNSYEIFHKNYVPKNLGIIKIDIDSYDYDLLNSILINKYQPKILLLEYNPIFPPNIHFHFKYSEDFKWMPVSQKPKHLQIYYGASINAWNNLLHKYNYSILDIDWYNCIFIHNSLLHIFNYIPKNIHNIWNIGWLNRKNRSIQHDIISKHWLHFPRQEHWKNLKEESIIVDINNILQINSYNTINIYYIISIFIILVIIYINY